ncbi:GmrSD restriction endonuclease domain-containing protein [Zavarzinia sp.]|uniref:GmrSD restriction endonuclease domain-containing protein n=1 Tax=Zavarzinia sp. TaxID=2027920 RepID=UPI003BB5E484
MFDATKEDLRDLLRRADDGRLQLPDFQRDYVWGDEDVKSLLASIAKGFPVGALLTLQSGGDVAFKPRLLAGVPDRGTLPDELLLDGQQRITSLYQATYARRPVRTRTGKGTEVLRFYYLDMKAAVAGGANIEDAIVGVPEDRVTRSHFGRDVVLDLSSRDKEYAADHFPLNLTFDSRDWFFGWRDHWRGQGRDVADLERDFYRGVLDHIERYQMPLIRLDRRNSREAICLVFEKVNVGGKKLDAFELVTAIYAADSFDLRADWNGATDGKTQGRRQRIIGIEQPRRVLSQIASTDFLQACTVLHTRDLRAAKAREGLKGKELPQITCRRDALLALPLSAYRTYADAVEQGFVAASDFLIEHKIVWDKDVPYPPQIVTLAGVFAIAGNRARTAAAKAKLARWFWSIACGELYGSSTESRVARDIDELVDWLEHDDRVPASIGEAVFQQERLKSLRMRISAAYKALHALIMLNGCKDFITERPAEIATFFRDSIDIHHIFPQAWCRKRGIPPAVFNSIVNKTPLSRDSNQSVGGDAPSVYLRKIEKKQGLAPEKLDAILRSHLIDPAYLRADDFDGFFNARLQALTALVGKAMDKPVVLDLGGNEREFEAPEDANREDEEAA